MSVGQSSRDGDQALPFRVNGVLENDTQKTVLAVIVLYTCKYYTSAYCCVNGQ